MMRRAIAGAGGGIAQVFGRGLAGGDAPLTGGGRTPPLVQPGPPSGWHVSYNSCVPQPPTDWLQTTQNPTKSNLTSLPTTDNYHTRVGEWASRAADMEVALPGPLALDCEDMFKEITKKLYGEEGALDFPERGSDHDDGSSLKPEDHITAFGLAALMQNGFPPPGILHANFQPKTNPAAEDKWTATEESLQWTASRIASYNPAQKLFKCVDCECVGFLSRVAEHWLGTHSNARVFQCPQCAYGSAWARCVRIHLVREHSMPDDRGTDSLVKNNPVLDEVTKYLQRLKVKVDGSCPQPAPAAVGRAPAASPPAVTPVAVAGASKRYGCPACPYATDRRDLFTRHENIHRDEKPFECYVCQKQFNRADHVKKHFLRMHRDHPYDLNRIRRQIPKSSPGNYYPKPAPDPMVQSNVPGPAEQAYSRPSHPKNEHNIHQIKSEHDGNSLTKNNGTKKKGEKRYSCCYCPWSGVDNWCLKRHLNTHLKPFVCALCDYKAARSERLSTHVSKVHNKKACGKCSFLAEDQAQLNIHLQEQHHVENRNIKVPNTMLRAGYSGAPSTPLMPTFGSPGDGSSGGGGGGMGSVRQWRPPRQQGAARLFNYMEASDGSDQDDYPDGKAFAPVTERSVQDFPEAGDAGAATAASPARAPEPKRRSPKKKRSHDKENKKSSFSCNICSASFKTTGLLAEHSRRHSPVCPPSSLRSPLLVSNSASPLFDFGPESSDELEEVAWDLDENGRHSKRSRKQSRPKKVIQIEPQPLNGRLVSVMDEIVSRFEDEPSQMSLPPAKVSLAPSNSSKQIDRIICDLVKHKENQSPSLNVKINRKSSVKRKNPVTLYGKLQRMLKAFEKSHVLNDTDERSTLMRARKIASTLFFDRLRNRKPNVIFKCKLCRLKFKHRFEICIHYQYCKNKNMKPNK